MFGGGGFGPLRASQGRRYPRPTALPFTPTRIRSKEGPQWNPPSPHPPNHRSQSVSTRTTSSTSPMPLTSWADRWAPIAWRPPPPVTGNSCRGPTDWAGRRSPRRAEIRRRCRRDGAGAARRPTSAVRARAKAHTALHDLLVTAPAALREQLTGLYKNCLIQACKQLPEPETPTTPTDAITMAIKSLAARRCLEKYATSYLRFR